MLQLTKNKENFTAFTPISDGKLSGIGEGMLSIKGYGAFHFDLGKNGQTLKISNDAYVPLGTRSLLSIQLITDKTKLDVVFRVQSCFLPNGMLLGRSR